MNKAFKCLSMFLSAGLLAAASAAALAQSYPQKPIRLVIPFPPAGATDVLGRALGQKLSENMGQPVVVENRPGAGSTLGSDLVAKSAPDGYTLLLASGSIAIAQNLYAKLGYDLMKSFEPVSLVGHVPHVLVTHPSVPARTVKELVALAKAKPGTLNSASQGNGTLSHLELELFKRSAGVDIVHVPYKGSSNAMPDLLAGNVSMFFDSAPSAMPFIKKGQLKALGVVGTSRLPLLPEVPTMTEAGLPGFEVKNWFAVLVPAGTPKDIVARLNAEVRKAVAAPDMVERMSAQGAIMESSSQEQLTQLMKADLDKWARLLKEAKVQVE